MNVFNTAQETVPERNVTSRSVRSLCKENNELKVSRMNRILIIPKDTKKLIGISYTPKKWEWNSDSKNIDHRLCHGRGACVC